jgi:signal transduction histidine kinase
MSLARRFPIREFFPSRRGAVFAFLLSVVVVGSLIETAGRDGRPIVLLLIPPALAAILLFRARPAWALPIAVAVAAASPGNRTLVLPVMATLYTIAGRAPWRVSAAAGAGAAVVSIVTAALWGAGSATDHGGLYGYAIGAVALYAAAIGFGLYFGAQRRVRDGLRERAERLDRERELLADRAVAEERVRIAQELHDIVAHNVSLMVVEAQALGATVPDDRVTERTQSIADLGRQAMTEMHTTLRLLRADGETPELSPQPGLAQLERLIEQLHRAGQEVELTIEGQPRALAQGVDLSAYRIVQEALTNVVKHASGARTHVTVAYRADGIELTIVDTEGESRTTRLAEPNDGHGVIGMRERAALFGGRLTAEALTDGFKVTASLPYSAAKS